MKRTNSTDSEHPRSSHGLPRFSVPIQLLHYRSADVDVTLGLKNYSTRNTRRFILRCGRRSYGPILRHILWRMEDSAVAQGDLSENSTCYVDASFFTSTCSDFESPVKGVYPKCSSKRAHSEAGSEVVLCGATPRLERASPIGV